jgi:transcription termination factor Rho
VSVLQRKELENSPLADLHAIASELGIEGYRTLRRDDLITAILDIQGGAGGNGDAPEPSGEVEDAPEVEEAEGDVDDEPEAEAEQPEPKAVEEDKHEVATGVLDVLSNASGFLRREDGSDVYISPAQIRRCELRTGDTVTGSVRPPRRNERHPSLVRVEQINGRDAEPLEQRPRFEELTPVHARERLPLPGALVDAPFGKGSRVAIAGPAGAGATRLLREIVSGLVAAGGDISLTVLLADARPEELTDWRRDAGVPVVGGSFDDVPEQRAQAAQLAVESAKRVAERGGDAVVAVDSLTAFDPALARRLFGAARNLEEAGSVTIVAVVDEDSELLRVASTRVVLEAGGGEPVVARDRSGTQRADLLG